MKRRFVFALIIASSITFLGGCTMLTQKTYSSNHTQKGETFMPEPTPDIFVKNQTKLNMVLSKKDNLTSCQDLITQKLDIDLFIQKFDSNPRSFLNGRNPLITDFDDEFTIECLREIEEGKFYSVHEVEQGGLLYVFYNSKFYENVGNYVDIINWYYVKEKLTYQDFSSVTNGTGIEKVSEIDSATHVYIERANNYEKTLNIRSCHYLDDGILTIFYSYVDGNLEVNGHDFQPEFQVNTFFYEREEIYKGQTLPIDAISN